MSELRVPCAKVWHSVEDQVAKLRSRGMVINDSAGAADFLRHLNYYCFTGYGLVFERPRHSYLNGTTFEQVRATYEFDRALRDLFTESIELIELDLRTTIAHRFGETHGAFGHTLESNFYDARRHPEWLKKLREETERSSDLFIKHHKSRYLEFPDVPVWVAAEIISFGSLSNLYRMMQRMDQKRIASRYRIQPQVLASWIHHLVYVRNLCAHHARLWDRIWSIKPDLPAGSQWSSPSLPGNTQVSERLKTIAQAIHKFDAAMRAIDDASRQQSENATAITSTMETLTGYSQSITEMADATERSASALRTQSESITHCVVRLRKVSGVEVRDEAAVEA